MLSDVSCCTDSIFMTEDHDVSCSRTCSELSIDHCYEFDSRTCQENCSLCNGEWLRWKADHLNFFSERGVNCDKCARCSHCLTCSACISKTCPIFSHCKARFEGLIAALLNNSILAQNKLGLISVWRLLTIDKYPRSSFRAHFHWPT